MAFNFFNPVAINFGAGALKLLPKLVNDRKFLLITSPGWSMRGIRATLASLGLEPHIFIDTVDPNPMLEDVLALYDAYRIDECEVIVAIGGGSVLDTAKALAVRCPHGSTVVKKLIQTGETPEGYQVLPMIAIPTTAGTGSEVTPWGTIWDFKGRRKYSVVLPDLWPECCICDPELTLSLPKDITIQTGLDALSHALESLWNTKSNPFSEYFALDAVKIILKTLPLAAAELENREHRSNILYGSLLAGLALSQTRTTVAHALSYPLTLNHKVPHGLACSFSLPAALDALHAEECGIREKLVPLLGTEPGSTLRRFLRNLGQPTTFIELGISLAEAKIYGEEMITYPQVKNFRGDANAFLRGLMESAERYYE